MTPKEKAKELYNKFLNPSGDTYLYGMLEHESAKECALIAVNEIIESSPLDPNDAEEWLQPADWFSEANISADRYWIAVKKEIEAL